jgi:SAM-dependent methyltransferase
MSESRAPDLTPIAQLYEDALEKHGTASQGVGWPTPESHRLRFDKLAQVIDGAAGPVSINDLGCGYGAFLDYLHEAGIQVAKFRGYDISENMLARARELHPDEGEFLAGSVIDATADYSFACGIFNVRRDESEYRWRSVIEATLDNMAAHSTRGFAFNLLSTYVDYRMPHLYYGDPCYFFDLSKRRYSKQVALLHDYPLYEWTLLVRKS